MYMNIEASPRIPFKMTHIICCSAWRSSGIYIYIYTYIYIYADMSVSVLIDHRLCFIDPSLDKFRLLAYAHSLYHAVRHDRIVFLRMDVPSPPDSCSKGLLI